jgi:hypothetical protein
VRINLGLEFTCRAFAVRGAVDGVTTVQRSKNIALLTAMALAKKSGRMLAMETGLHPVSISHLLNNRTEPKPATAKKIAAALGTTPSKLGWIGGDHE